MWLDGFVFDTVCGYFVDEICFANSVVRQRVVWENHVDGILFDQIVFSMKYLYKVFVKEI